MLQKQNKADEKIKPGDAAAFKRLFNFLIKCQSLQYSQNYNQKPLDTPDVIYMILLIDIDDTFEGTRDSTRQMEETCSQN